MGARPETGTEVEGGGRDFAGASRSAETGEAAGGIPAQVEARVALVLLILILVAVPSLLLALLTM